MVEELAGTEKQKEITICEPIALGTVLAQILFGILRIILYYFKNLKSYRGTM